MTVAGKCVDVEVSFLVEPPEIADTQTETEMAEATGTQLSMAPCAGWRKDLAREEAAR